MVMDCPISSVVFGATGPVDQQWRREPWGQPRKPIGLCHEAKSPLPPRHREAEPRFSGHVRLVGTLVGTGARVKAL